jgi:hypothetical protein
LYSGPATALLTAASGEANGKRGLRMGSRFIRKSGLIPQGKLRLPGLPRFKQHTAFKNLVLNQPV